MNSLSTIFLGIVQGLTEFLPISSSGHLVLFQNLLGMKEPELFLDITLHVGTLIAVCFYFRSDLKGMIVDSWLLILGLIRRREPSARSANASLALWVIVGTVPTGLIGVLFKSPLEDLFGSVTLVGFTLLFTGLIVALTRWIPDKHGTRTTVGLAAALAVGIAQGIAITPGISRSGATIVCGMLFKLNRDLAARFSFLLSIPAILGAMVLHLGDGGWGNVGFIPLMAGLITSIVVGLLALKILMGMVRRGNLYYFAPYCWAAGLVIILGR
jgi:undecaprenyl-diphosphatase